MKKVFLSLTIGICLIWGHAVCQTIPVGSPVLDEYYRRMQLLGKLDSTVSFSIRPLDISAIKATLLFRPDSSEYFSKSRFRSLTFANSKGKFELLPFSWQQQFNSSLPYGWNDGAMIPARGYQTMVSGGFFLKLGILSIQARPEFVFSENKYFSGFENGHSDSDFEFYYRNYNEIDAPQRFGNKSYNKVFLGQSSVRLTKGAVSLGLSNENLWWGPGIQNSIMMSNTAPGFLHLTLNTVRPVNTIIGSFEGQIIAGKLVSSGFAPLSVVNKSDGMPLLNPMKDDWRYLSAVNIVYHPKWIPGLFLGYTRTFLTYHDSLHSFSDYMPLFAAFQKAKINGALGETTDRDQRTSFFTRWLFQKAKAEVYFEYGLNDNSYNIRDLLGSPQHSRVYLFGFSKLITLPAKEEFIAVNAEVTQLSQSVDYLVRQAGSFYVHSQVRQGYTNLGQVLGAGIGSGGNLQSLNIHWTKEMKRVGFSFDRLEHNMDLANDAGFLSLNGLSRRWVDFAFALDGTWNYKNLLFNAKLQGIKSLNYQWILKDYEPGKYYIPHNDVFNFHGELGVTYRF